MKKVVSHLSQGYLVIFSLVLLSLLLGFYGATFDIWTAGDIGGYLHNAVNLYYHNTLFLDDDNTYFVSPLYTYLTFFIFKLFGVGLFQTKIVGIITGSITIFLIYGISKKLTGNSEISFLVALFYCLEPWIIASNKHGNPDPVWIMFYFLSVYICLISPDKRPLNRFLFIFFSGILFGVSFFVKNNALFLGPFLMWILFAQEYQKANRYDTNKLYVFLKRLWDKKFIFIAFTIGFLIICGIWFFSIVLPEFDRYTLFTTALRPFEIPTSLTRAFFVNPGHRFYDPEILLLNSSSSLQTLLFWTLASVFAIRCVYYKKITLQRVFNIERITYVLTNITPVNFCIILIICGYWFTPALNLIESRRSFILFFPLILLNTIMILRVNDWIKDIISVLKNPNKSDEIENKTRYLLTFLLMLPLFPTIKYFVPHRVFFLFLSGYILLGMHIAIPYVLSKAKRISNIKLHLSILFFSITFNLIFLINRYFLRKNISLLKIEGILLIFAVSLIAFILVILFWYKRDTYMDTIALYSNKKALTSVIVIFCILVFISTAMHSDKNYEETINDLSLILSPSDVVIGDMHMHFYIFKSGSIGTISPEHVYEFPGRYSLPKNPLYKNLITNHSVLSYLWWNVYRNPTFNYAYGPDMSAVGKMNKNAIKRFEPNYIFGVKGFDKKLLAQEEGYKTELIRAYEAKGIKYELNKLYKNEDFGHNHEPL